MSRVNIVCGKDMHTKFENGYHTIWEYPNEEMEKSIKDDTLYTVKEDYEDWEYIGGLAGDSEGERHKVYAIEETPPGIRGYMEEQKKLGDLIFDYKYKFLKENRQHGKQK